MIQKYIKISILIIQRSRPQYVKLHGVPVQTQRSPKLVFFLVHERIRIGNGDDLKLEFRRQTGSNGKRFISNSQFFVSDGTGISREGSVLDLAVDESIVKKSGAWYTYDGEQLGQGRENAKKFLQDNPEVMVEISDRVWKTVMPEVEEAVAEIDLTDDDEFSEADDLPMARGD